MTIEHIEKGIEIARKYYPFKSRDEIGIIQNPAHMNTELSFRAHDFETGAEINVRISLDSIESSML